MIWRALSFILPQFIFISLSLMVFNLCLAFFVPANMPSHLFHWSLQLVMVDRNRHLIWFICLHHVSNLLFLDLRHLNLIPLFLNCRYISDLNPPRRSWINRACSGGPSSLPWLLCSCKLIILIVLINHHLFMWMLSYFDHSSIGWYAWDYKYVK